MSRQKILDSFAEVVSFLTNPAILLVVAIAYIAGRYANDTRQFWHWTVYSTILLVLPGLLYAVFVWKREKRVDIDITDRHDRLVPLMLASLGALVGVFLISSRIHNQKLEVMGYIFVALLISITIITSVWKISLHTSALTAMVSLLTIARGPSLAIFFVLLLPVGWARLRLKQHTPAQLIGGALVGAAVTYFLARLFNSG